MFLFILESIGTPELILIAVVALIVFGPRKLPQMAKTLGKTMSEFRNATNEFKTTWEKEAALDVEEKQALTIPETENRIDPQTVENDTKISETETKNENLFPAPTIRELSASDIAERFSMEKNQSLKNNDETIEKTESDKRNWL